MKEILSYKIPRRIAIFIIIGFLALVIDRFFIMPKENIIKIGNTAIIIEVADTPGTRARGLSGRPSLPENHGMLFVFDKADYHPFWMKEMLIPLDFVWIENGRIVEITENVKPEDYPPPNFFASKYATDKVLEINAGAAKKFNIKAGDKINF